MNLTTANKIEAERYVNDIMGKPLADTTFCSASPGSITFDVRAEWFPEIVALRMFVQAKFEERLGSPSSDLGCETLWRLSPTRSISLWNRFGRSGVSITLMDESEVEL